MKSFDRRQFLATGIAAATGLSLSQALAQSRSNQNPDCLMKLDAFSTESHDSPFFEHFHQLVIPVSALVKPSSQGFIVTSSPVDGGSYDVEAFQKFIRSSGLKEESLRTHSHDVALTKDQLERIASGQKDVEVRVISKNGNYVHNFLITAPPSALAKLRHQRKTAS